MTPRFLKAVERVFELEGNYSADPVDHGGPTLYGISKKSYPDVDFATLTKDGAREIYYRDFWQPIHLDFLMDEILARILLIFATNAGPQRAARALQRAVNVVGTPLSIDGKIGPATLSAVNSLPQRKLRIAVLKGVCDYYSSLIEKDQSQARFRNGWKARYEEFKEA